MTNRDDLRSQVRETIKRGIVGEGDGDGGANPGAPIDEREFWRLQRRKYHHELSTATTEPPTSSMPLSMSLSLMGSTPPPPPPAEEEDQEAVEKWIGRAIEECEALLADDGHLDRILVARNRDPVGSVELFLEQVRFRARLIPRDGVDPGAITTALSSGAWRLCGYSKDGCPISNFKLEFWDPSQYHGELQQAIDEYTRYVVYMIELMIASGRARHSSDRQDQFMVVYDLTGFYVSMVTKTNIRLMIRKLIYVAQTQYPERLRRVVLINAPFGFETAWAVIKPWLEERTVAKITFGSAPDDLLPHIDGSVLSVAYGGTHAEYPIPSGRVDDEAAAAAAAWAAAQDAAQPEPEK